MNRKMTMKQSNKKLVYLAGPYTKGDQSINTTCQIRIMHDLFDDGVVMPYAPLLSHFAHFLRPTPWEVWMEHSYEMIRRCDAILRRAAIDDRVGYHQYESRGADLEEEFAEGIGIPVFFTKTELYEWVRSERKGGGQ